VAHPRGWHGWDHLRTVLRVESERITPDGNDSLEQRYYISSLRYGRLSAGLRARNTAALA